MAGTTERAAALAQAFGLSPSAIVDMVINAANDYIYDAVEDLQNSLLANKEFNAEEVKLACFAILHNLQNRVDKSFDKFELFCLRYLFVLPEDAMLPGDPEPATEPEISDSELAALCASIRTAKAAAAAMKQELEDLEALSAKGTALLSQREQVDSICRSSGVPHLKDTVVGIGKHIDQLAAACDALPASTSQPAEDAHSAYKRRRMETFTTSDALEAFVQPT